MTYMLVAAPVGPAGGSGTGAMAGMAMAGESVRLPLVAVLFAVALLVDAMVRVDRGLLRRVDHPNPGPAGVDAVVASTGEFPAPSFAASPAGSVSVAVPVAAAAAPVPTARLATSFQVAMGLVMVVMLVAMA
jgi:hypothetical protein